MLKESIVSPFFFTAHGIWAVADMICSEFREF